MAILLFLANFYLITNYFFSRYALMARFLSGANMRALFNTTASVAVLCITADHKGFITPKAPRSIAAELTIIVAVKFW